MLSVRSILLHKYVVVKHLKKKLLFQLLLKYSVIYIKTYSVFKKRKKKKKKQGRTMVFYNVMSLLNLLRNPEKIPR